MIINSVFVALWGRGEDYKDLDEIGANHFILSESRINRENIKQFNKLKCKIGICVDCFGEDGCPANPASFGKLRVKIDNALKYKPNEIWLDHFRFDGRWEVRTQKLAKVHKECKFCIKKSRFKVLLNIANKVRKYVPKNVEIGYFAVPFKHEEYSDLVTILGQDHKLLAKYFDAISPMLYHRMIKKPISYIHEYVEYLYNLTNRPIMPIIQIKDMPDSVPDKLGKQEALLAAKEAVKPPSMGVSIFLWEHAVEKNKIHLLEEMLRVSL